MPTFLSFAETRTLGAPVVRLFRAALGRDPGPDALAALVSRLRQGATLPGLARELAADPAFLRLHGPDAPPDEAFIARLCRNALGDPGAAAAPTLLAAALSATRADLLLAVAESPEGRARIPLLPGLAPGAAPDDPVAYRIWAEEYDNPDPAALGALPPLDGPCVTVALAAGDTDAEAAIRTARSLRDQNHPGWRLNVAFRPLSAWPREALERLAAEEERVRLLPWPAGEARAAALNRGLPDSGLACVLRPGDRLHPAALYESLAELARHPRTLLLFTDEDVADGNERRLPRFKPALSPDALLAGNAVGQLALYRAELLRRLGGLRPEAAPFEDYDLALRAVAAAGADRVRHLPAVLIHRAEPPADWPAPAAAPPRAAPGLVAPGLVAPGLVALDPGRWPRPRFRLPAPPPLVSVIVPTRDRADLLAACVAGVLDRTDYPAIELLVADNGSAAADALVLLARLDADPRARVLRRPGPFNFAALNNAAAAEARGEVLVLLNNDTEVLHPDWLAELAAHAVRPDVGAVGARLLYPDGTVQHAGILLGPGGAATHVGRGAAPDAPGYEGQLACTRDLSAVTGACLAIRREVWARVGGMDERLAVTWNDVDLCLRVRAAGLRVLWTPHATLTHREGVSRGLEAADAARAERFRAEQAIVRATWGEAVERDPFLNPNLLATEAGPLALTRPRRARPWDRARLRDPGNRVIPPPS